MSLKNRQHTNTKYTTTLFLLHLSCQSLAVTLMWYHVECGPGWLRKKSFSPWKDFQTSNPGKNSFILSLKIAENEG